MSVNFLTFWGTGSVFGFVGGGVVFFVVAIDCVKDNIAGHAMETFWEGVDLLR